MGLCCMANRFFKQAITIQKAFAFFKYSRKNWDKNTMRTVEVARAQNLCCYTQVRTLFYKWTKISSLEIIILEL